MGWEIKDYQGKEVIKQSKSLQESIEMQLQEHFIEIKGSVKFGDYETDLKNVYGAFTRRDRFVTLGSTQVGLLDEAKMRNLLT